MSRRLLLPALILLLPAALSAQNILTSGRIASGAIGSNDAANGEGQRYDDWRMTLKARHRYRVTMRSRSFDSFLAVGRGQGGSFTMTVSDDDGAGGSDATLVFTPPADGDFTVRARPLGSSESGDYSLALTDEGEVQPLRAQLIQSGQAVSGALDSKDATTDEGKAVDYYRFSAKSGRHYVVTMLAQSFDAYLEVGSGANGVFAKQRSDDDGGGGTNARLDWVAREGGEIWILARGLSSDTGRYTLLLEDLGDAPPPAPAIVLSHGRSVDGRLEMTDEQSEEGHYDLYYLDGAAGDLVVIRMDSEAFDPVVVIGRGEFGDWHELDKDNDGGLGTNAHLEFRLPEAGRYTIRARGIGRANTGAYTIRLE
ncbi:MAG: PPC domain-containing protein [Gemmatimonadales bacterium]